MKYKVVSLILIIPLILMFCVFSAANIATIKVPISVSGLSLFHDNQESVNLAESNEFQINAKVLPRNAKNQGLNYSYEILSANPILELNIDENGLVSTSGCGTAKVTVSTKEGAYKKSFLLVVTSTKANDILLSLDTIDDIIVGDTFNLLANVIPQESLDKSLFFSSSNPNIIKIDQLTGNCRAISSGKATLKAKLENGLNGEIEKEIQVTVLPIISSSLITIDGKQNLSDKIFSDNYFAVMEVNYQSFNNLGLSLSKNDILLEYDSTLVDSVELEEIENNNGIYKFNLYIEGIKSDSFSLKAKLNKENYTNYFSEINLTKIVDFEDIELNLSNFKNYIKLNATNSFSIQILPQDFTGFELSVYFTNENITFQKVNNIYYYVGNEVGQNTLNVDIVYEDEVIKSFSQKVEVLNPPTSLNFALNTQNFGIEDLLTIGNKKIVNNEYQEIRHTFDFTTYIDLKNIEFSTSNEEIAKFIENELVVLKEGKVTIKAEERQSKLLGINLIASLDIRCVDGVEVGTYQELMKATNDSKQVVLTNDIMLGEQLIKVNENGTKELLKSPSECASILSQEIKQMDTTYEWNYYKYNPDINSQTPPKINYILKFTNNCFGNGFYLNANNITNMLDESGALYEFAKFRGPLDLVAIPNASVKAQDNICFIASDNVIIDNVELIGANLGGLDNFDLNELNYIGTVLEVMGDNVKIVNSRIRNGRNCVRVFGKEDGNEDKINVLIESSIISNAREFLIKMGTNSKKYGEFKDRQSLNLANGINSEVWEECSPKINDLKYLNNANLNKSEYNNLVNQYKDNSEFINLVKTNLTIKNCVLHTSGLFSIGLESSFAGPALDGGRWNNWNFFDYGWRQIAGTSYPTMLNLEGSVKIYDWKNLSNIDSSTLIEGNMFDFNLSKMINNLYSKGDFTDIITEIDGEKYAHGGIVMYGGGKNYSLINNNLQGVENFENYIIGLDSLDTQLTTMLKYASGKEPFRMFMYGKNSNFNYYKQVMDMESGIAFEDIGKYIF